MDKSLQILRSMRSQLAMFDFLWPGEFCPAMPKVRHWRFWKRTPANFADFELWAGGMARARVLMDLDNAIQQIEELGNG